MAERSCRRYRVRGRVQNVGFRAFVWRQAEKLGLRGWVRNRGDGSVEVLVVAPPEVHESLLRELHEGPRRARVEAVEVTDEPDQQAPGGGFSIRSDR